MDRFFHCNNISMNNQEKYNRQTLENLLFRRQFFLGRNFIDVFASLKKIKLNESMFLTVHSDLEITQAVKGEKSIILLGYVLDPYNPKSKNSDIIEDLIDKLDTCDQFFEYINEYGGRWILIV